MRQHLPKDIARNQFQLFGRQGRQGYDWWWHSLTARHAATGEERAFFIEFFTCNPDLGGEQPVFGQTPERRKPSYLMVKCGTWGREARQLHRFFGWSEVRLDRGVPFRVEAADCLCSETELRGSVCITDAEQHPEWMCDNGEMRFDLKINKLVPFNVGWGASRPMRRWQLFEMFWHAEGMKSAYEGTIVYNGETYLVEPDTCFGYADKNWGRDFTSPWVWLSSCDLVSQTTGKRLTDSVFDIGGGRPKIGPLVLERKLLSSVYLEGRYYEFNFSKFWTFCRTRFNCQETDTEIIWHVEQRTLLNRLVADLRCPKAEMLLVNYEAPTGLKRHNRLWNGGTGHGTLALYRHGRLIDTLEARHAGCEYGEFTC